MVSSMKTSMQILRVSAGRIDTSDTLYANAIIVDENVADQVTPDRIDVGQQNAKVSMDTFENNKLALALAKSGLVPGDVVVDVVTAVKGGVATFKITNFFGKDGKPAFSSNNDKSVA